MYLRRLRTLIDEFMNGRIQNVYILFPFNALYISICLVYELTINNRNFQLDFQDPDAQCVHTSLFVSSSRSSCLTLNVPAQKFKSVWGRIRSEALRDNAKWAVTTDPDKGLKYVNLIGVVGPADTHKQFCRKVMKNLIMILKHCTDLLHINLASMSSHIFTQNIS